jgi:molybdenum cofactor guanylyltransferase
MEDTLPAVILAGGLSRRMGGGDKGLRPWGDSTLLAAVRDRLAAQAAPLALSANGDPARFMALGLPVLPDPVPDRPGPLAGLLAAMLWAEALGRPLVLTAPCDAPFLPRNLAPRLLARHAATGAAVVASSGGRLHPVVGVWPVALAPLVAAHLAQGRRRVLDLVEAAGAAAEDFALGPPDGPPDPFLNLNTPADEAAARAWIGRA